MRLIAIAEEAWAGGRAVAEEVARLTDFRFVGPEEMAERLAERGLRAPWEDGSGPLFAPGEPAAAPAAALRELAVDLLSRDELVAWGWGAELLFRDDPGTLTVRICAPWDRRLARCAATSGLDEVEAARVLVADEERTRRWLSRCFGADSLPAAQFALTVRSDRMDLRAVAELIVHAADAVDAGLAAEDEADPPARAPRGAAPGLAPAGTEEPIPAEAAAGPRFAHPSEAELARLLDFYQIAWLYEPKTFPLRWDADGHVTEAFTPDFYLPELDLYLELTTLKQSLVTKKNRKLRRLRELYPEVRVKVIYGRDFRHLLRKYGWAPEADAGPDEGTGE